MDEYAPIEILDQTQEVWGRAPNQSAGLDALGNVLGTIGGASARQLLQDPAVMASLEAAAVDCKTHAEEGVTHWARENAIPIMAILAGTVAANALFTMGVLAVFLRNRDVSKVRKERKAQEN